MTKCSHCKQEIPNMDGFDSLYYKKYHFLCDSCSNIAKMFTSAPEPTRPRRCRVCGRIIKLGQGNICWMCLGKSRISRNK